MREDTRRIAVCPGCGKATRVPPRLGPDRIIALGCDSCVGISYRERRRRTVTRRRRLLEMGS